MEPISKFIRVRCPKCKNEQIIFGKIDVNSHVSAGAYGNVYRGTEAETERDVAIKLLKPDAVWSMEKELLVATITDQNIVPLHYQGNVSELTPPKLPIQMRIHGCNLHLKDGAHHPIMCSGDMFDEDIPLKDIFTSASMSSLSQIESLPEINASIVGSS